MRTPATGKTLLVFTQTFAPDPAAVGQYMHQAAAEMALRGYRVIVYTAASGHDDPSRRYRHRETLDGVQIRRVRFASFGKKSFALRVLGLLVFSVRCFIAGMFVWNLDAVLASTSPPLIGVVAALLSQIRQVPLAFWAMDLNPDQLIALGQLQQGSVVARTLGTLGRFVVARASYVIALDRFMAERLVTKGENHGNIEIIPPWPHQRFIQPIARDQNTFRHMHGLADKKVVMYSGNHTLSNPLTTLLAAAARRRGDDTLHFVFIGGGIGKAEVAGWARDNDMRNVLMLPYQATEALAESLSAADVHIVSLGNGMSGIIHPSKVYASMAAARPILYLGPKPSHVTDLLERYPSMGWHVQHGDVDGAFAILETIRNMAFPRIDAMGEVGRNAIVSDLSEYALLGQLADGLEAMITRHS